MTMQLEAIYQGGGILRLLQPLDIPEGQKVLLDLDLAELPPAEDEAFLDTEYHRYCEQNADHNVLLEQVRTTLSKIPGSMSDEIIAEREERF